MEWEGSNSGPGWQDVTDMLTALDSLHGCQSSVMLTAESWYGQPRLVGCVVSTRPALEAARIELSCTTVEHYPTKAHKTVSGWLYGMLHRQDQRINRLWYRQAELALTEPVG